MKPIALILVILALAGCSVDPTSRLPVDEDIGSNPTHFDRGTHIEVTRDPGGKLFGRLRHIDRLERMGKDVHITGRCVSACTLYLSMRDNVCVTPDAMLGFHGPSKEEDTAYNDSEFRTEDIEMMSELYPTSLRRWFLSDAAPLMGRELLWIRGSNLIDLGIQSCETLTSSYQEAQG